jgi:hypothetical protein
MWNLMKKCPWYLMGKTSPWYLMGFSEDIKKPMVFDGQKSPSNTIVFPTDYRQYYVIVIPFGASTSSD